MLQLAILLALLAVSIAFNWHEESDLQWAERCTWKNGNNMSSVRIPGEKCGPQCALTNDCTHFTWNDFNGGTCWLKRNPTSLDKAISYDDGYSICGIMKTASPSPSTTPSPSTGKTTRVWNCHKPLCAYNGKADVTAPVGSCQRDGWTAVDADEKNGSNDGEKSYMCNSNQPWAMNDNLAYGFALAGFRVQPEHDWCCACYELKFTSGPVEEKSMIVQVIGHEFQFVDEPYFSLLIPASSEIHEFACVEQWNATIGWSPKYDGITSRSECNKLPLSLQPGCFWRFDWFKNADKPDVTHRRVKCPPELTQKSNCRRNDD